jgi:prefoldin subunit 5
MVDDEQQVAELQERIKELEREVEGLRQELRDIYNSETKAVKQRLQSEV